MKWKGKIYIDGKLPFGLCLAPKIFTALAVVYSQRRSQIYIPLPWWFRRTRPPRFRAMWPKSSHSAISLQRLGRASGPREAGWSYFNHRVSRDNNRHEPSGALPAQLPNDKLKTLLATWTPSKEDSCSRKELELLLGVLSHACTVTMYSTRKSLSSQYYHSHPRR